MAVKYDPNHFPPLTADDVEFTNYANSVFQRFDEDTLEEDFRKDIEEIGRQVGSSLMAHTSRRQITFVIADKMHDAWGLLSHSDGRVKSVFMQGVFDGAERERRLESEYGEMDAINASLAAERIGNE